METLPVNRRLKTHQAQAALAEPLAQPGQRGITAEIGVYRVAGNRKARSGNVVFPQVGERFVEFSAPLGMAARDALCRRARLPDTQEPDPVEPRSRQVIQVGIP